MGEPRFPDDAARDGANLSKAGSNSNDSLPMLAYPSATTDLYAAAWALSQRDFELDRLFNAEFYYEI